MLARVVVTASLAVLLISCSEQSICKQDEDCPASAFCDLVSGACFARAEKSPPALGLPVERLEVQQGAVVNVPFTLPRGSAFVGDATVTIAVHRGFTADPILVPAAETTGILSIVVAGDLEPGPVDLLVEARVGELLATQTLKFLVLPGVRLNIVEPGLATVYVRSTLTVKWEVTGKLPDAVELIANGESIGQLKAGLAFDWDTGSVPEGTYALKLRATIGSAVFESDERTVTVDRTPPVIVDRVPKHGDVNVSGMSTIQVDFSEPLVRDSATGTKLRVNGVETSPRLEWLDGDKSFHVILDEIHLYPAEVEIRLPRTIQDAAGNQVMPVPWAFTLPKYVTSEYLSTFANVLRPLDVVLKPDGISALLFDQTMGAEIVCLLTDPINVCLDGDEAGQRFSTLQGRLALSDDGTIYLALRGNDGTSVNGYVYEWKNGTWHSLGPPLSRHPGASDVVDLDMLIVGRNNPVVAWEEHYTTAGGVSAIASYVASWNGEGWEEFSWTECPALSFNCGFSGRSPRLAKLSTGTIVFAALVGEGTSTMLELHSRDIFWNKMAAGLKALAIPASSNPQPSLAVGGGDEIRVAFTAKGTLSNARIFVYEWKAGWTPLGSPVGEALLGDAVAPVLRRDGSSMALAWSQSGAVHLGLMEAGAWKVDHSSPGSRAVLATDAVGNLVFGGLQQRSVDGLPRTLISTWQRNRQH